MKRKIAALVCLLTLSLSALALVAPARALPPNPYWVEPAYKGWDPYYGMNITGYLTGTNWTFTFSWTNPNDYQINVTALRMYFSWGRNYTSAYSTTIPADAIRIFSFANTTPTLLDAPEQMGLYSYNVYVHNVNGTNAELTPLNPINGGSFAVLSQDHLACLNIWAKYYTPPGVLREFPSGVNVTEAQVELMQAKLELAQGSQIFQAGVFDVAKTHLQAGDTYFTDALTAWDTNGTAIENADLAYKQAQTTYYTALGDANKMNAYGWILFGLGWVFIGLGIIIYAARRPKVVVQS
jgi:hypothetical protein